MACTKPLGRSTKSLSQNLCSVVVQNTGIDYINSFKDLPSSFMLLSSYLFCGKGLHIHTSVCVCVCVCVCLGGCGCGDEGRLKGDGNS